MPPPSPTPFRFALTLTLWLTLLSPLSLPSSAHPTIPFAVRNILPDDMRGNFFLYEQPSVSDCPRNVTHGRAFSLDRGVVDHLSMNMTGQLCDDGYNTTVLKDSGDASSRAEGSAKELVNEVIDSGYPSYFAIEENGRVCEPQPADPSAPRNRFYPGTLLVFVKPDADGTVGSVGVLGTKIYMFTSAEEERCVYIRQDEGTALPSQSPIPDPSPVDEPSTSPIASDEATEEGGASPDVTPSSTPSLSSTPLPPSASSSPKAAVFSVPPVAEETDNPDANGDGDGDSSVCFPATAIVTLDTGRKIAMEDLRVGDNVLVDVGDGYNKLTTTSQVFAFSHRDVHATPNDFVRLYTAAGHGLTMSNGHYIYVLSGSEQMRKLVRADSVTLDDFIMSISNPVGDRVVAVTHNVQVRGLYNPQTLHGDIVVDGVVASTFTTAVQPAAARALLAPVRAVFNAAAALYADVYQSDLFQSGMGLQWVHTQPTWRWVARTMRKSISYVTVRE